MSLLAYRVVRCLLLDLLAKSGLTQRDIAIKLGVKDQQIHKYCWDKQKMSIETAKNISAIFGINIDDLYEWTDEAGEDE